MAGEIPDLVATVRTGTGKGAARQTRRDGDVPGIVYGGGQEPLPIRIPFNVLMKRLKAGHFLSTLFNLKIEGHEDQRVVCRGVQRHVVKDLPTHVDFLRISPSTRINLRIDVQFENHSASPGLKRGGTLVVVRPQVELEVTAGDIPDHITVDLTGREVGDVIHINDVALPAGVRPTIDRNFVIANISAPSGLRAADAVDEPAAE
ncbi:50S ribosomal protein L25/general stress protein Ctc [Rubellimicrobium sp. CFH 75288]|uniref:50S ribosomal protein L25/general stress protein Ctc n=1 Tax=Rubellimicrobium sp. CFH 75288 TaxID=2697034 RepID=UPI001411C7FE|nr:50S ribosomal protein L25/general stress protein Ctc [Rubellimicrobium sp. CFH 75288]NAZ35967.1 50S ribosomal protein L25/general stress protein Ctc [Rubellimicrobium sp. CFH 75288]